MRKKLLRKTFGILMAGIMAVQPVAMTATTVYAEGEDGIPTSSVVQGDAVLLDDATPETANDPEPTPEATEEPEATPEPTPSATPEPTEEPESTPEPTEEPESTPEPTLEPATPEQASPEQASPESAAEETYTVTIDPNGGNLPPEWIKTANTTHGFDSEDETDDVEVTEEDGIIKVTTTLDSLNLMNPSPADDTEYFDSWTVTSENTDILNKEENSIEFNTNEEEYSVRANYRPIAEESDEVDNAREYTEASRANDSSDRMVSTFALKPTDSYTEIELAMEGLEFVYEDGQIQTFTAPYDGDYVITAYGANGGTGYAKYDGYGVPGRGGMTEATVTLKKGQTIYMYIGEAGGDWSTERTFGGGGAGAGLDHAWIGYDDGSLHIFGRGGGATYVSIDQFDMANAGQAPQDFTAEQQRQNDAAAANAKKHIIMLAAGGGGAGEIGGGPYYHVGLSGGGYEGAGMYANRHYQGYLDNGMMTFDAKIAGRTLTFDERIDAHIWPATQTRAGYGYHYSINGELYDPNPANQDPIELLWPEREARNWGSFFFGSNAMACTGAGGGGWFGGGTDYSFDGGGGSSYIGTSVQAPDGSTVKITNGVTESGANARYDNTKSAPFYVNGRVLIRLKNGGADLYAELQKAASEDVSKNTPDTVNNDEYGQGVTMQPSAQISNQTVGYTALIYSSPANSMQVTPQWQYCTYRDPNFRDWNQGVASGINGQMQTSVTNEDLGVLQPGNKYYREEYNGYRVTKSTLRITNVPLSMWDTNNMTAYYFRCHATGNYTLSGQAKSMTRDTVFGGLTATYPIALYHNGVNTYKLENTINGAKTTTPKEIENNTRGHGYSDWKYPQLDVVTSKTLRSFTVEFTGSYDGRAQIFYDTGLAGAYGLKVTGDAHSYTFENANGLGEAEWENFLRNMTFRTYDPMTITSSGVSSGTHVRWSGYEEVIHPETIYNTQIPGGTTPLYITGGNVNITQNGNYYIYGYGQQTNNRIRISDGVTATIVLDNVHISAQVEDSDNSSFPDSVVSGRDCNLTFILVGSNSFNAYSYDNQNGMSPPGWYAPNNVWVCDFRNSNITVEGNGSIDFNARHPNGTQLLVIAMDAANFTQKSGTVTSFSAIYHPGFRVSGAINVQGGTFTTDGYDDNAKQVQAGSITVENGGHMTLPRQPTCGTVTVRGGSTQFECNGGGCGINVQPYNGYNAITDNRTYVRFTFDTNTRDIWDTDIIGTNTRMPENPPSFTKNPGTVSGRVWAENDNDGIFDTGTEPTVEGITVTLRNPEGTTIKTTKTDKYGAYKFDNVTKGQYKVTFSIEVSKFPDDHYAVTKRAGGTDNYDIINSAVNQNYTTDVFNVEYNSTVNTMNCGVFVPSTISGFVWDDTDKDGIYDQGEQKIKNAKVTLYNNGQVATDAYGQPIASVLTDGNGAYKFINVPEKSQAYEVAITSSDTVHIENAAVSPIPNKSTDPEIANTAYPISYGDISAGRQLQKASITNVYVPVLGTNLRKVDVNYRNCALSIKSFVNGYVWTETDYNGVCNGFSYSNAAAATDPLQPYINVTLRDTDGTEVAHTATNKSGYYEFDDVAPGQYIVTFEKTDEFDALGKISADAVGFEPLLETVQAETNSTQIGNNTHGVYNDDGVLTSLTSDKFTVRQVAVKDAVATKNAYTKYVNAGMFAPSHESGLVWEDYNQDGIRQDTEYCLDGVKLTLMKLTGSDPADEASYTPVMINGKEATIETGNRIDVITGEITPYEEADTGKYSFDNLPTGTYAVKFYPNGTWDMRFYLASPINAGNDDTIDNDATPTYTWDQEELVSSFIGNIVIPTEDKITTYGYDNMYNDFGAYQKLRDVIVTKQIYASEIEWDYGNPTFVIKVYGTDQKGVDHIFYHAFEFTPEYVSDNTDENGMVSMTYTYEGCPYARYYNVMEYTGPRYEQESANCSENGTIKNGIVTLDLRYDVEGEAGFVNKENNYTSTGDNGLVINHFVGAGHQDDDKDTLEIHTGARPAADPEISVTEEKPANN